MGNCDNCIFHESNIDDGGHPIDVCYKDLNGVKCSGSCDSFIAMSCQNCQSTGKCLFESSGYIDHSNCYNYEMMQIDKCCHYCSYFNKCDGTCGRTGDKIPKNTIEAPDEVNDLVVGCSLYSTIKDERKEDNERAIKFFRTIYSFWRSERKNALSNLNKHGFNQDAEKRVLINFIKEI